MAKESDNKPAVAAEQLSLSEQRSAKEIEKLDAEIAKINADVQAGRERFYKTAAFYAAISPVVLACLGLIFTWASGWFDVQKQKIENDKTLLTIETKNLEKEKSQLTHDTEVLEARKKELEKEKSQLTHDTEALEVRKKNQQAEVDRLTTEVARYKTDIEQLQHNYDSVAANLKSLQATVALYNDLKSSLKPLRGPGVGFGGFDSKEALNKVLERNQKIARQALDYVHSMSATATNHGLLAWELLNEEWPEMYNCIYNTTGFGENPYKCFRDADCVKYYLGLTNIMYFDSVSNFRESDRVTTP